MSLATILLLLISLFHASLAGEPYLYKVMEPSEYSPIIEYDEPDMTQEQIFNDNKHHRIVEFYNPYCGHCINFKPKYIQTAREILQETTTKNNHQAQPPIDFYAISCKPYRNICKEHMVKSYPTIQIYPAGTTTGNFTTIRADRFMAKAEVLKLLNIPNGIENAAGEKSQSSSSSITAEQKERKEQEDNTGTDEKKTIHSPPSLSTNTTSTGNHEPVSGAQARRREKEETISTPANTTKIWIILSGLFLMIIMLHYYRRRTHSKEN